MPGSLLEARGWKRLGLGWGEPVGPRGRGRWRRAEESVWEEEGLAPSAIFFSRSIRYPQQNSRPPPQTPSAAPPPRPPPRSSLGFGTLAPPERLPPWKQRWGTPARPCREAGPARAPSRAPAAAALSRGRPGPLPVTPRARPRPAARGRRTGSPEAVPRGQLLAWRGLQRKGCGVGDGRRDRRRRRGSGEAEAGKGEVRQRRHFPRPLPTR